MSLVYEVIANMQQEPGIPWPLRGHSDLPMVWGRTSIGTHVYKLGSAHPAVLLPSYDLVGSGWPWGLVRGRDVP